MTTPVNPPSPSLNTPLTIELREVLAAMAVLSRLDKALTDEEIGDSLAKRLDLLGRAGENNELPASGRHAAAPEITDVDSARTYVIGLRDRLQDLK